MFVQTETLLNVAKGILLLGNSTFGLQSCPSKEALESNIFAPIVSMPYCASMQILVGKINISLINRACLVLTWK